MRALIVDDSRFVREYIAALLSGRGVECHTAENGQRALEHLRTGDAFDLAVVDWNMPELNGLELVKQVRIDPRFAGIRIVMVTTEAENGSIEAALNAGADEYLFKPFDEPGLFEKLQMIGFTEL